MRTRQFNPSTLEVALAEAFSKSISVISKDLPQGTKITDVKTNSNLDNPQVVYTIQDADGDTHEVVISIIQRLEFV